MMNKLISKNVIYLVTVIVLLTGCTKFLDQRPTTEVSTDLVFSDVPSVTKALASVYSRLVGDAGYGIRLSLYYPVDNDEMQGPTGAGDNDRRDIARYTVTSGNAQLTNPFNQIFTGIEFAKAYVHSGMLGLDGEKMSKSKGNLLFVSKLLEKGVDPMEIRWALMSSKYSEDRMWTDSVLHGAREKVAKLRRVLSRSEVAPVKPLLRDLVEALSNDLDTPTALAAIERWCDLTERQTTSEGNLMVDESGLVSRAIDSLLGLAL